MSDLFGDDNREHPPEVNGRDGDYNWRLFWYGVALIALLVIGLALCYVMSFLNW